MVSVEVELFYARAKNTFLNHDENGRAWSRLSAHACQEAAASELRHVQILKIKGTIIIPTVAALLPVPARKT